VLEFMFAASRAQLAVLEEVKRSTALYARLVELRVEVTLLEIAVATDAGKLTEALAEPPTVSVVPVKVDWSRRWAYMARDASEEEMSADGSPAAMLDTTALEMVFWNKLYLAVTLLTSVALAVEVVAVARMLARADTMAAPSVVSMEPPLTALTKLSMSVMEVELRVEPRESLARGCTWSSTSSMLAPGTALVTVLERVVSICSRRVATVVASAELVVVVRVSPRVRRIE